MIFKTTINTEINIKTTKDLPKLKIMIEVNNLDKPNFSAIARELGVDRRTVKKYYDGNINKIRKPKKSKIDDFYDIISNLLSAETDQIFYYKTHLYRYLVREKGLQCSRSDFNYYILKHKEFAEYFKPKSKKDSVKSETPFGKQAQFDWKEKLNFTFKNGEKFIFNVGSLVLSASRFKYWAICPSTSQAYLFDFLANAFEELGGVPNEIVIDNASTMMDKARTEHSEGKVNPKFQQLADDFGFTIVPCVRARPNTKAKVENPMRIIDEIMTYNGLLNNEEELYEKMRIITNEANSRICQATGVPPILVFKKEREILGFLGKTSDVRMAQYESEARVPKHDLVKEMAGIFDVSTHALTVPDIDTYIGLMHTFFALEDMYGLKIDEMDGEVVLRLDKSDYSTYSSMDKMLRAWLTEAKKLENGEITKEEYNDWRYKYPELDTHQIWAKVPSQEISDMLLAGLKEMEKEEKKETKRKKKK